MRQPLQRTSDDLVRALNNISRLVDERARAAQANVSEMIAENVREIVPDADVSIVQTSQNTIIDVTDDNLVAREFGTLSQEADRPIARALENVQTR